MKKVFIVTMSLAILLSCFNLNANSINAINSKDEYFIDEPYKFPITQKDDEWDELDTHMKKIEACQIPENILKSMTTEALVETVLNYPLLVDMCAWSTQYEGYLIVSEYFNGLEELENRNDALASIDKELTDLELGSMDTCKQEAEIKTVDSTLKPLYMKIISDNMEFKKVALQDDKICNIEDAVKSINTFVRTPEGTPVSVEIWRTYEDSECTAEQLEALEKDFLQTYNSATLLRSFDIRYNCHSYAWYSQSSTNRSWMPDPTAYMTDGSYSQTNAKSGAVVLYDSPGIGYDHSGIVTGLVGVGSISVTSKWGESGLYTHSLLDCPYSIFLPTCIFYEEN